MILSHLAASQSLLRDTTIQVSPQMMYSIEAGFADALALKCNGCSFDDSFISLGDENLDIFEDPHNPGAAFIMFSDKVSRLSYFSGKTQGAIQFIFIFSGTIETPSQPGQRKKGVACEVQPIGPEIWREGLPEPVQNPDQTTTNHIVIHHSATSNNIPDPYSTIRNIYVYHTQVNKWNDIGYNYLIAPDGTIFQGRDSKGLFDADYVLGAHMCGVNNETMAICMLGTFTDASPSHQALKSLYNLIKWKADKDELDIFGSTAHAIGPPSYNLPPKSLHHVAGHRDGCSPGYTECPGNFLYQQLDNIRDNAFNNQCSEEEDDDDEEEEDEEEIPEDDDDELPEREENTILTLYPNPAFGQINSDFEWAFAVIYDTRGHLVKIVVNEADGKIDVKDLASGMYILKFTSIKHGNFIKKAVIID